MGPDWTKPQKDIRSLSELFVLNPAWVQIPGARKDECEVGKFRNRGTSGGGEFSPGQNPAVARAGESLQGEPEDSGPRLPPLAEEWKTSEQGPRFSPPVRLSNIQLEDFIDVARALELFRQAVKCKLVSDGGENSRLQWFAAIERARAVPARNPAGLFVHIVKNRSWASLSEACWDRANARLKAHLYGSRTISPPLLIPADDKSMQQND